MLCSVPVFVVGGFLLDMNKSSPLPPLTPELYVRDLTKSLAFYVDMLGFSIAFERPENRFAAICIEGSYFMLEQMDSFHAVSEEEFIEKRQWRTGELAYPFGRGVNFQIILENVDDIYQQVVKHAYPITGPLEEKWYRVGKRLLGVRQFMLMDPDGFLLRFSMDIGTKDAPTY